MNSNIQVPLESKGLFKSQFTQTKWVHYYFPFFFLIVHSLHSIGIYLASNLCNVGLPFLRTMDMHAMYLDGNYNW